MALGVVWAMTAGAQSYNTAFGFRFGDDLGFSFTQRVLDHTTIDLNASDGLFSQHKFVALQVRSHYGVITRRFNFFLGGGGFLRTRQLGSDEVFDASHIKGVSGVMGAEFTLGRINVSLDYMPQYILNKDYTGQKLTADSALSIKYVLWKRKTKIRKFFEKIF
jgi:hypothetical protein